MFERTPSASSGAPGLGDDLRTRAQPVRKSIQNSRFARWHHDSDIPVEEEGWLLTYLDTITLLLVMMVVMLIFSEPIKKDKPSEAPAAQTATAEQTAADNPTDEATPPAADTPDTLGQLPLDQLGSGVEVIKDAGSLRFRISSELLFPSGEAGLTAPGLAVLDSLLPALQMAAPHPIVVEGHTDDRPISTVRYPSNWELAAGRAGSVVRHLQSRGIAPARMRATGYADTHPIASNTTAQGQAANRRVELMLELPQTVER